MILGGFTVFAPLPHSAPRDASNGAIVVAQIALLLTFAFVASLAFSSAATASAQNFVPGEVLVRFEAGTTVAERREVRNELDLTVKQVLPVPQLQLLKLQPGQSVNSAVAELEVFADVKYAEPNFIRETNFTPNDTLYPEMWGLNNFGQPYQIYGSGSGSTYTGAIDADIDAPEAWDLSTGSPNATVAVMDTGVDYLHQDIAVNIHVNGGESGGGNETNGVDDDTNGFVDDVIGWDFVDESYPAPAPDNDPMDGNGHGTHVAGTAAGAGNNAEGIAGVSMNSGIVPVKVLDDGGSGTAAMVASGIAYAGKVGADVANGSFGSPAWSQSELDAIELYPNTLYVFSAGNSNNDNDGDKSAFPCSYPAANIVCVASSDAWDNRSGFSSFGATSVDLAAPGTNITSTKASALDNIEGDYWTISGTSMASPHVAGAAALLKSIDPSASAKLLKSTLMDGVDPLPAFAGKTITGGRLNLATSAALLNPAAASAQVSVVNGRVVFAAGPGASNNVSVSGSSGAITVSDSGTTLLAGAGCTSDNPNQATCSAAATSIRVDLGDMNDTFTSSTALASEATGGAGDDTFSGGSGDDVVDGGAGADTINGGDGSDTANYDDRTAAVSLTLDSNANDGEMGEGDSIGGTVENLVGGGGSDTLTGNGADNALTGGAGVDQLSGLGGADNFRGGSASDTIDGGDGVDAVTYSERFNSVFVSLDGVANDGENDEFDNVLSNVENITGGRASDELIGDADANSLSGGRGNDSLMGNAGSDVLGGGLGTDTGSYVLSTADVFVTLNNVADDGSLTEGDNVLDDIENITGGSGNDTLVGSSEVNVLRGGPGNDSIAGGDGIDTGDYSDHLAGVSVSLDGNANDGSLGETDNVATDIENLTGTSGVDVLTGSSSDNMLIGGDSNDTLNGLGGDDRLQGGQGTDAINGGDGSDMVDYYERTPGHNLIISLDGNANDGEFGEADAVAADVENVQASWGQDFITGNDGDNFLIGSGGADTIDALDGSDVVFGDGNHAESVSFGGCWWSSGHTNTLNGGDGNDVIEGGFAMDNIDGGSGDDELMPFNRELPEDFPEGCIMVDPYADDLVGGDGIDTVAYDGFPEKIEVTLEGVNNDGWLADDNVHADIENIRGGAKGDVLMGSNANNIIQGAGGGDLITGGAGSDDLSGEDGPDRILAEDSEIDNVSCGDQNDSVQTDASDQVAGDCESINQVLPSVSVDDGTLIFDSPGQESDNLVVRYGLQDGYMNMLTGEPLYQIDLGSSALIAGEGCTQYGANEARCGGWGVDSASFLMGDMNDFVQFFSVGYETASIFGGDGADQLAGSAAVDTLSGGNGDDSLRGFGGADVFVGGDGNDTADYYVSSQPVNISLDGLANDGALEEGDMIGNDVEQAFGSPFDDVYVGNEANNWFLGSNGDDVASGGAGNDSFFMGAGNDTVNGGEGHDILWGESGTNQITGGPGNDGGTINADDDYQGGDGTDWAHFSNATSGVTVSLDDVANDGMAGASANIHSDVENVFGSPYDDVINGSSENNYLAGWSGNDHLQAGEGSDVYAGDAGNDTFADSSLDPDNFAGGADHDSINYFDRSADLNISIDGNPNDGEAGENDNVNDEIESVNLGTGNDVFTGSAGSNFVVAGDGNDIVDLGEGNDNVVPGSGNDVIIGGPGHDGVGYNERNEDINVSFDDVANDGIAGETDNVGTDFESIQGGNGNDTITGSPANEYLSGNGGNDTIRGNGGADYLMGSYGDDSLFGRDGVGDDYIWCFDGQDVAAADASDDTSSGCEEVNLAPNTTITSGPIADSTINDATPTISFSSNEPGATFECRADAGSWTPCVSPYDFPALADGERTVEVRALDAFSADATPATRTFTVDTTAPDTVIDSGPANGNYDDGTYQFEFHSTDSGATLECRVTGTGWLPCNTGVFNGTLGLNTELTFDVRSTDAVGNVDSTPATRTFRYVVPVLSQTNATIPSTVNLTTEGTIGWVHWGLATTPNLTGDRKAGLSTSVLSDAVQLNGGTLARQTSGVPSYNWTGGSPTASSSGTATAITNGAALNRGFRLTAEAVPWTMRTLKLYVGAQNTTGKLTSSLSDGSMPTITDTSVTGSSTTTPTNRVFTIKYRSATNPATLTVDWTKNTSSTASSSKVLLHSATLFASSDTTDPDTSITSGPADNAVVNGSTATFGLSSDESGVSYECKIDAGAYAACNTPYTTPVLADGTHTFRARAVDAAGNIDISPVTRQFWTVTPLGSLTKLNAAIDPTVDLSTEGTTDWAHWGTSSASLTQVRKSGITQQISVATKLGSGTTTRLTTGVPSYSWTGGTPTASSSGTTTAIATGARSGRGFRFTVPATNTTMKTVKVYVGVQNTTGLLSATLSDGSAVAISDTSVTSSSTTTPTIRVFTINFRSAAPSATLTVSITQNTSSTASSSRVLLHSATLVTNSDTTAPTTTITAGPANGETVAGTTATYEFTANEPGSTLQCRVDAGAYTTCSSPFTTPSQTSGTHKFSVRAIDAAGNIEPRPTTRTFMVP